MPEHGFEIAFIEIAVRILENRIVADTPGDVSVARHQSQRLAFELKQLLFNQLAEHLLLEVQCLDQLRRITLAQRITQILHPVTKSAFVIIGADAAVADQGYHPAA